MTDDLTPFDLPDLQLPTAREMNNPYLAAAEEWIKKFGGIEYARLTWSEMAYADSNEPVPAEERARLDALKAEKEAYIDCRTPEIAAEWAKEEN